MRVNISRFCVWTDVTVGRYVLLMQGEVIVKCTAARHPYLALSQSLGQNSS